MGYISRKMRQALYEYSMRNTHVFSECKQSLASLFSPLCTEVNLISFFIIFGFSLKVYLQGTSRPFPATSDRLRLLVISHPISRPCSSCLYSYSISVMMITSFFSCAKYISPTWGVQTLMYTWCPRCPSNISLCPTPYHSQLELRFTLIL